MKTGDAASFYEALSKFHREWQEILVWARNLGLPEPPPPVPVRTVEEPAPRRRPSPSRATRAKGARSGRPVRGRAPSAKRRSKRDSAAGDKPGPGQLQVFSGPEVVVPLSELSRPQLVLGLLRRAEVGLMTDGVLKLAAKLGIDFEGVAGGPSNAVHGALWRERHKGTVRKRKGGPWELVDPEVAPKLDVERGVAYLPHKRMPPGVAVEARRKQILEILGTETLKKQDILARLRQTSRFGRTRVSNLRDDLESLVTDGRVEKVAYGLYRRVAHSTAADG